MTFRLVYTGIKLTEGKKNMSEKMLKFTKVNQQNPNPKEA